MMNFLRIFIDHLRIKRLGGRALLLLLALFFCAENTFCSVGKPRKVKKTRWTPELDLEKQKLELEKQKLNIEQQKLDLEKEKLKQQGQDQEIPKKVQEAKIAKKDAEIKTLNKKAELYKTKTEELTKKNEKTTEKAWSEKIKNVKVTDVTKNLAFATFIGLTIYGIIAAVQAGDRANKEQRQMLQGEVQKKALERSIAREASGGIANPDSDIERIGINNLSEEELQNRCPFVVSVEPYDPQFSPAIPPPYQVTYLRPYHLAPAGVAGSLENKESLQEEVSNKIDQETGNTQSKADQYKSFDNALEAEVLKKPDGYLAEILQVPPARSQPTLESLDATYQAVELAQKEILAASGELSKAEKENNKDLFVSLEKAQKELLAQRKRYYPEAPKIVVRKSFFDQKKAFLIEVERENKERAEQERVQALAQQQQKQQEKKIDSSPASASAGSGIKASQGQQQQAGILEKLAAQKAQQEKGS